MPVQEQGLNAGEEGTIAIQMPPAGLDHTHIGRVEIRHGSLQKVGWGNEVSVKDGHQLSRGSQETGLQGTGLETLSVLAVEQLHGHSIGPVHGHEIASKGCSVVGGVVQDLYLEPLLWIVQLGHGVEQAFYHVSLVEKWELDRHPGPGLGWTGQDYLFVGAPKSQEEKKPVAAIEAKSPKDSIIDNEQESLWRKIQCSAP
jgi:hypothetical protein